jgi:hypothetical protein
MRRARVFSAVWTLLAVLPMLSAIASAQETPPPPDPIIASLDARVAKFFEGVSTGKAAAAYQDLLSGGPLLKQTDALKLLVERTAEIEPRFGRYRASEQLAAKRVGNDLVLLKYLYKCENFPVVWHFAFYRPPAPPGAPPADPPAPDGGWRIVTVRFDSDLRTLEP